jgi:hypothetical protein
MPASEMVGARSQDMELALDRQARNTCSIGDDAGGTRQF